MNKYERWIHDQDNFYGKINNTTKTNKNFLDKDSLYRFETAKTAVYQDPDAGKYVYISRKGIYEKLVCKLQYLVRKANNHEI